MHKKEQMNVFYKYVCGCMCVNMSQFVEKYTPRDLTGQGAGIYHTSTMQAQESEGSGLVLHDGRANAVMVDDLPRLLSTSV